MNFLLTNTMKSKQDPKHKVKFKWIKGHNDHPYNERCDVLATSSADSGDLLIDEGYENSKEDMFDK